MIVANWKMHFDAKGAIEAGCSIKTELSSAKVELAVCAPCLYLKELFECFKDTNIKLGAQNLYFEDEGAYTGEISAMMLKSVGCEYVIIGHSERRQIFGEDDELVNKKLKSAIKHLLVPILCVGESLSQRQNNETFAVLENQLVKDLQGIKESVIIAYEPIWAIGSGKVAQPDQIFEVHEFIKKFIDTKVLYGGSANPQNALTLSSVANVDGFLVGGASLDAQKFKEIVLSFEKAKGVA
ncbi:Phosphoglycerate kinase [Desulfurella amilsii]|uniref:Triosephosphate isomerase n=1 Tax=Desulfurella amilsii TaxID=1562698 RepID=A0A1X4XYR8_9BACT|nr:triose-phosphate isomerase [Desulfurella amilsii]OSS42669.1 Phosphoglycerate kinase [Desulfurella amilsii]